MYFWMLLQKFGFLGLPFRGNSVDFAGDYMIDRIPFGPDRRNPEYGLY